MSLLCEKDPDWTSTTTDSEVRIHFPYKVELDYQYSDEVFEWTRDELTHEFRSRGEGGLSEFYFASKGHATIFALRFRGQQPG